MSADKHTPGPWEAQHNNWEVSTIYAPTGEVARCCIDSEVSEETQDQFERAKEANARLIATAPRLLAALEAMLEEGDGGRAAAEARAAIAQARAAIAQARGLEGGVA